jgi:hypothetical protein
MTPRRWGALATIGLAAIALALPWPPGAVESAFAGGVYPVWQRLATGFTNALPFAAFDAVLALAVGALIGSAIVAWRRTAGTWLRRAGAALLAATTIVALVYLWFLASWGLNYQREPLARRLKLRPDRPAAAVVVRFADETVAELNRLRPLAMAAPWPDADRLEATLAPAFQASLPAVGAPATVVPGRPKWSLLQPYLRWAGIDGVTNPFVPEVIVNFDLLPIEWPFTLAHEWGHLAGLAHEAEASYAGWHTCLAGTDQSRYSARLWAVGHLLVAVPPVERTRLVRALDDGPIRDLRAIAQRSSASVPVVRRVSWATYDRYLKSNRVSEGLASYDEAIALILAAPSD